VSQTQARPQYRTWQAPEDGQVPQRSWVEFELEEPWTVTLGFLNHGDELVLADVRIFPTRDDDLERGLGPRGQYDTTGRVPNGRTYGEWSWDPDLVPPGGLTARTLRKLKIGDAMREAIVQVPRPDGDLAGTGFVTASRLALGRAKPAGTDLRRRRSPELLASVALIYEQAVLDGIHPNQAIYEAIKGTARQVAEKSVPGLVRAARAAGYLTPAIKGRAQGKATPAAHEQLVSGPDTEIRFETDSA
jgi:hypothetical protein